MKPMNHRLTAMAAALLFGGSAAMAQFFSAVYGTAGRIDGTARLQPESRQLVAMNGPSAGVFGAVADARSLPVAGSMHDPHAPAMTVGAAVVADARAPPEAPGSPPAAGPKLTASAALDMTDTIHAIKAATLQARQSLLNDVSARVEVSNQAMADLSSQARVLRGGAQAAFKVAVKDVHAREKALKRSIRTANKARPEGWGEARADLAANYNAFAEAVAHAEAVASWSTRTDPAGQIEDSATLPADDGAEKNALGPAMVSDDQ